MFGDLVFELFQRQSNRLDLWWPELDDHFNDDHDDFNDYDHNHLDDDGAANNDSAANNDGVANDHDDNHFDDGAANDDGSPAAFNRVTSNLGKTESSAVHTRTASELFLPRRRSRVGAQGCAL